MNYLLITLVAAAFLVSLGTNLVYKFTTNQQKMKDVKAEMKALQAKLRAGEDVGKVNKRLWEINMQYMSESMRPTMFTLIPVLLVFLWLGSFLAYEPILPGQEFSITAFTDYSAVMSSTPELTVVSNEKSEGTVTWRVKGGEGTYTVWVEANGVQKPAEVIITREQKYANPVVEFGKDSPIRKISVGHAKTRPFGESFSLFGYYPGWVAAYIVFSLIFSLSLRKFMNLH